MIKNPKKEHQNPIHQPHSAMKKRGSNKPLNSKIDATSKTQFKVPQNWGI
jgi:hypothetical protein